MMAHWDSYVASHPLAMTIVCVMALVLVAWLAGLLARRVLLRALVGLSRRSRWMIDDALVAHSVPLRLAQIVPAAVIQFGIVLVPGLSSTAVTVIRNVAFGFTALMVMLALAGALSAINDTYEQRNPSRTSSIKSYVQLVKLAIYILGTIVIVATLIDRSPLILLSGMGAMAAVLLLVFQDTLLSLVASVQLSAQDMIRVGDWIEMPQLNADGDVIDIALHTVKVQNWDRTITTIPTRKLISESFKNWRGMNESGARRIKRALNIDLQSVAFLDDAAIANLRNFRLLRDYLDGVTDAIGEYNRSLGEDGALPLNARRLTNIGTFRAYVHAYLKANPDIRQDFTLLVRQLPPGAEGVPLELYCFTATTAWADYERIQSDVFDHLIAILPEFGLRLFQSTSGSDVRDGLAALQAAA
jgi:miniconductance mechanosensitive channel